jgi:hypothetical protein|tara:strand:- start:107 stop:238 length:132 start_codon:yes stop_codon:yes gene_type:complete
VVVVFPGIIIARFFIEEEEDIEEVKALEAEKAEDVVLVCVQKE